jgi:ABC-type transport system involved in cytochrome c biogenesis permease subunit
MQFELNLLWVAIVAYVLAGTTAIVALVLGKRADGAVIAFLVIALGLHGTSIGLRWDRLGHGPFVTMFEILSSNVWSLLFLYLLVYLRYRPIRPTAAVVMPVMFVMMAWLMFSHPGEGHLPPTYKTIWLFVHIGLGKIFLGSMLVSVGLSAVILMRAAGVLVDRLAIMPGDERLDDLSYRFVALALIFDTLMLIAGAIWAQDAWGRYWDWDPLETWAFLTWLFLAFAMHLRLTVGLRPVAGAGLAVAVFAMAFLTFFGVPFVSITPHKGAI